MPKKRIVRKKNTSTNKLKAKKRIIDGIKFDSILESKYYEHLKELKKARKIRDFELQKIYILQEKFVKYNGKIVYGDNTKEFNAFKKEHKIDTTPAIKYIADFVVTMNDGNIKVIDTKGKSTPVFEMKRKLFEAKFTDLHLSVICMPKEKCDLFSRLSVAKKPETKEKLIAQINKLPDWVDYYADKKAIAARKKARKKNETKK